MERTTLRKLLEQIAQNGKSARYPSELKEAAVEYLRAREAAGGDLREIAREIGMVRQTLVRWDAERPGAPAAEVVEPATSSAASNETTQEPPATLGEPHMDERVARFRAGVVAAGVVPGRKYPLDLRREAVALLEQRLAEGAAGSAVAEELGVSWEALARWRSGVAWQPRSASAFRKVAVVSEKRPAIVDRIVVHAGSIRVEGLDMNALVELLRRLG